MSIALGAVPLTLADLRAIARDGVPLALAPAARAAIAGSARAVERIVASGKPAYGINTGFGRLSQTRIEAGDLAQLQTNIVLSHAAGTGPLLDDATVRLALALKIASLARGASGVRPALVDLLVALYQHRIVPLIPAKGSVGASATSRRSRISRSRCSGSATSAPTGAPCPRGLRSPPPGSCRSSSRPRRGSRS